MSYYYFRIKTRLPSCKIFSVEIEISQVANCMVHMKLISSTDEMEYQKQMILRMTIIRMCSKLWANFGQILIYQNVIIIVYFLNLLKTVHCTYYMARSRELAISQAFHWESRYIKRCILMAEQTCLFRLTLHCHIFVWNRSVNSMVSLRWFSKNLEYNYH